MLLALLGYKVAPPEGDGLMSVRSLARAAHSPREELGAAEVGIVSRMNHRDAEGRIKSKSGGRNGGLMRTCERVCVCVCARVCE